ncbi:MAG: outer membrane protein assembly factor BamE (lipoprotein component of BamABCDE complex), partial [Algoriphagus sp.]
MKKISFLLFLAATALLSSCDYQKNNTIKQDDVNEGNERIYG